MSGSRMVAGQTRVLPALVLPLTLLLASANLAAEIVRIEIDGAINPVVSEFIAESIQEAESTGAEFLLMRLATPGGLGVSMDEIISLILNSQVPVVCYVAPKGSRAASAGFFILLSADVAAMAPGTNTGAAKPVFLFGEADEDMLQKVINDSLAHLRSIVEKRKRNYELAERAVVEAHAYTETEALEGGLIDLVADDEQALLEKLDGWEVTRLSGEKQVLRTQNQVVRQFEMTFRQRLLAAISSPQLATLLGLIGLVGLYWEFSSPGLIVPGVLGGICLVLALLGFSAIPLNYIGVILILLAIGLLVAEVMVQGFGVLGVGGIVSLVMGLLVLVDSPYPELRIGWGTAILLAVPFAIAVLLMGWVVVNNFRARIRTGREGLVGALGMARTRVDGQGGKVYVQGEWWNAVSNLPIEEGTRIRVAAVEDLVLLVEQAPPMRVTSYE